MSAVREATADRSGDLRNYALVTGAYWADTIADGAARVLVLFYFYERGYSPLALAALFLLYEIFGIVTNLVGGWLAARLGLKATLTMGLAVQLIALASLALVPAAWLVVPYVMATQALSGIAKDLTKMSSKSAVKLVAPSDAPDALFRWVAVLTGSKNALKGVGFFVGGLLLTLVGFRPALLVLMGLVLVALVVVVSQMRGDLGVPDPKARFGQMFSNNRAVNLLAAARLLLFASRDVWFVIGLPVYLRSELGWSFWEVGTFLAIWVIGYGVVQAFAPRLLRAEPAGRRVCVTARLRARGDSGRHRGGARRRRGSDPRDHLRPDRLRHRLRAELRGALVPDPGLRRGRQGGDERGLLLHGERGRPAPGDDPLGRAVRVAGARGLPVGVGRARARGGVDLAAPDDRAGPRGQPVDDSLMRTASSRACSSS